MDMNDLPPGYRFIPEKQELVDFYLRRKVFGKPLPSLYPKILDVDVYRHHPYDLLKSTKKERAIKDHEDDIEAYFFTALKKTTKNGTRISRCVGDWGTWKEQNTKDVEAYDRCSNEMTVVGIYKYFKFTPASGSRLEDNDGIEWQMHEYSLTNNRDIVLCHIVAKNAKTKKRNHATMSSLDHEGAQSKRSCVRDSLQSTTNVRQHGKYIPERLGIEGGRLEGCSSGPLQDNV